MAQESYEYIHQEINQEVRAIGGGYMLTKEEQIQYNDRKVLYLIGFAAFDTTCCGNGGCNYAIVPGYIVNWKEQQNEEGLFVSRVEAVCDESEKGEIRRLINAQEVVSQINFR